MYGMASVVSGMAAIWSLTAITLERALVIRRLGYRGAGKQTIRRVTQLPRICSLAHKQAWSFVTSHTYLFLQDVDSDHLVLCPRCLHCTSDRME